MRFPIRTLLAAALLVVAGTATSCAPYGTLGDVLGGDVRARSVTGEVRHVDTRRHTIEVRTREGRQTRVAYDRGTSVDYRGRRYPVTALERGDYVTLHVRTDRHGRGYVDRVVVRESVRDRGHARHAVHRLEGSVTRIDDRRGTFTVRTRDRRTVAVTLPRDATRRTYVRFQNLRRGDHVRFEGVVIARDRYELRAFR
jgi:hypothetical protein